MAAHLPRGLRDLYRGTLTAGKTVGRGAARGPWRRNQPPDRSRATRPHGQAQHADPHQPPGRTASRPGSEHSGGGYPQVSVPGATVAAAVAVASDHGGGHGPRPDRQGAVLRRRLRLDLGGYRPPPDHRRPAQQGTRGTLPDALARLGDRCGAGCGRRRPLPAGASLRPRRGVRPRPARSAAPGQAPARQREPLPGQPVRGVRTVRRTGRSRLPPGRRPLARHPPRQYQPHAGNADAEIRMARRHRVPLPDRRGGRRDPGPPRLDRHPAPVRPRLHRRPSAGGATRGSQVGLRAASRASANGRG